LSSVLSPSLDAFADGGELVPGGFFVTVGHGAFVRFAAGENDVAGSCLLNGEGDGLFAVADLPEINALCATFGDHTAHYFRRDVFNPLGAWVFGGYDREIRQPPRHMAHHATLLAVAQSRRTKHCDYTPVPRCNDLAGKLQRLFEAVGGVGKVNNDI